MVRTELKDGMIHLVEDDPVIMSVTKKIKVKKVTEDLKTEEEQVTVKEEQVTTKPKKSFAEQVKSYFKK